ncbi:hypothetical protein [Rhizobium mongolense]|uniref:Retron-type reverse transcriptase n=1 Tax=Rhizobium mongolense TaxID=57676 RepID=A0ABR6IZ96_9HYPH|nr:hypothetical protein [Rhizobium mongolense]MBB4233227.1 retron-type reverse transcriptase [Rhizobium mongolense]
MIDADFAKYFDSIDHGHLRSLLDLRIRDGVIRRMIDKWLNAGVLSRIGGEAPPKTEVPDGAVRR